MSLYMPMAQSYVSTGHDEDVISDTMVSTSTCPSTSAYLSNSSSSSSKMDFLSTIDCTNLHQTIAQLKDRIAVLRDEASEYDRQCHELLDDCAPEDVYKALDKFHEVLSLKEKSCKEMLRLDYLLRRILKEMMLEEIDVVN